MLRKPKGKERIIVAIDTSEPEQAITLVKRLQGQVGLFKFGFEWMQSILATLLNEHISAEDLLKRMLLIREMFFAAKGRVFWDGKFMDIPNTVAAACRNVATINIKMLNVHCLGGREMMSKAVQAVRSAFRPQGGDVPLVLGVTLLTSLGYGDLVELGFAEVLDIADQAELERLQAKFLVDIAVNHLADLAQDCNLDGIICSPKELTAVRGVFGPDFVTVTPGVRPRGSDHQDQKRVMTPGEAVSLGANYLVIGRPITEASDPALAAREINFEIEQAEGSM